MKNVKLIFFLKKKNFTSVTSFGILYSLYKIRGKNKGGKIKKKNKK